MEVDIYKFYKILQILQNKFTSEDKFEDKFKLIILPRNNEEIIKKLYVMEKNTFYIAKDLNYSGFVERINNSYLTLILYDKKDKKIISYLVTSKINKNTISIDSIVVAKSFRRLGIGKFMFEVLKFLIKIKNNKIRHIITVTLYDEQLINFYYSLGFKILKIDHSNKNLIYKFINTLENQIKKENIKAKINLQNIHEGILKDMFGRGAHGVILIYYYL